MDGGRLESHSEADRSGTTAPAVAMVPVWRNRRRENLIMAVECIAAVAICEELLGMHIGLDAAHNANTTITQANLQS